MRVLRISFVPFAESVLAALRRRGASVTVATDEAGMRVLVIRGGDLDVALLDAAAEVRPQLIELLDADGAA
jgi:hypothetical protein